MFKRNANVVTLFDFCSLYFSFTPVQHTLFLYHCLIQEDSLELKINLIMEKVWNELGMYLYTGNGTNIDPFETIYQGTRQWHSATRRRYGDHKFTNLFLINSRFTIWYAVWTNLNTIMVKRSSSSSREVTHPRKMVNR